MSLLIAIVDDAQMSIRSSNDVRRIEAATMSSILIKNGFG